MLILLSSSFLLEFKSEPVSIKALFIFTGRNEVWPRLFLLVSVILSTGGSPCKETPPTWEGGTPGKEAPPWQGGPPEGCTPSRETPPRRRLPARRPPQKEAPPGRRPPWQGDPPKEAPPGRETPQKEAPPPRRLPQQGGPPWHTVYERPECILLVCILVNVCVCVFL